MIKIRRAEKADCARLLELVKELALYEKAPQEVNITLESFTESGFGNTPVWWAFGLTFTNWGLGLFLQPTFIDGYRHYQSFFATGLIGTFQYYFCV